MVPFQQSKNAILSIVFIVRNFLKHGYRVIFLHRKGSLTPFNHRIKNVSFDDFEVCQETLKLKVCNQKIIKAQAEYNEHRDNLLLIDYYTVADYLFLLLEMSKLLAPLGDEAMLFLAAAVSDFFLADKYISEHKICSDEASNFQITLSPVPKMIDFLKESACPRAFIVSFKLETDERLVISKAQQSLEKYGHDLVVANALNTRQTHLWLVAPHEAEIEQIVSTSPDEEIEDELVQKVIKRHIHFCEL